MIKLSSYGSSDYGFPRMKRDTILHNDFKNRLPNKNNKIHKLIEKTPSK